MSPNLSNDMEEIRGDKERLQSVSSSESDLSEDLLQGRTSLNSSSEGYPSGDSETINIILGSGFKQNGLMEREVSSPLETSPMESSPITNKLIKDTPYDYEVSENSKEPVLKGSKEFSKDLDAAFEIENKEIVPSQETPPSEIIHTLDQSIMEEINETTPDSEIEEHNNRLSENKTRVYNFEKFQETISTYNNQNLWVREELKPFIQNNEPLVMEENKEKSNNHLRIYEKYGIEKQKEPEQIFAYPQDTSSLIVALDTNLRRISEQEQKEIRIDIPASKKMTCNKDPIQARIKRDKTAKSLFALGAVGAVALIGGSICYLLANDS